MTQLVKWNLKNNTWILAEIINRVNKKVKENVIHKVNKCFYVPNISRLRNDSLTHILSFLRFLNGNWHKITAWQIQTIIAVFSKTHEDLLMLSEYCIIEKESL